MRCLADRPAPGAWNMAVDEVLLGAARDGGSTVRFYRWEPGCLSFGRNQVARGRYDSDAIRRAGVDVVRRPTGGRVVFHHREITYSLAAPTEVWGSLKACYVRINRALTGGLTRLGVPASVVGQTDAGAPRPTTRACFRDPVTGEVTAGGRKLVGSAQWQDDGVFLQHGSILLHDDQHVAEDLRLSTDPSPASIRPVRAASLADWLDPLPSFDDVVEALVGGFEEEFDITVRRGRLSDREREAVSGLLERYQSPEWTWRR